MMKSTDFSSLDFDSKKTLAKEDPVEFERLRQMAIDEFIESAPLERRERLRGLQWRIDQERRNCTPLCACIRISKMMWEHVTGPYGLLGLFEEKQIAPLVPAKVIPFGSHDAKQQ